MNCRKKKNNRILRFCNHCIPAKQIKFAFQSVLMKKKGLLLSLPALVYIVVVSFGLGGCAQVGMPTGGPRDSTAPKLLTSTPKLYSTNFKDNKIVFTFDEYIVVDNIQKNLLVSPFPKKNPTVEYKLKTVTVKLKDTLQENTTYAINFGDAVKDNNEGNIYKDFTYVFSTGNTIDSLTMSGEVTIAETGKTDSTLIALLYRNTDDTTVQHRKPDYVARVNSKGKFLFRNLSEGIYKIYVLGDKDGGKTYNAKTELFAFRDSAIVLKDSVTGIKMLAYAETKDEKKVGATSAAKPAAEKKLRLTTSLQNNQQGILDSLKITFNRKIKTYDENKFVLTDTLFKKIDEVKISVDSTNKIFTFITPWKEETDYVLFIDKTAVTDTLNEQLAKPDTIKFKTKKEADYGHILLRFTNLDSSTHPVLQFIQGEQLYKSVPITGATWSDKLFEPGEYELRILFDRNRNGKWDPGNYAEKKQPETAITLDKKLTIKANWDNERDIKL